MHFTSFQTIDGGILFPSAHPRTSVRAPCGCFRLHSGQYLARHDASALLHGDLRSQGVIRSLSAGTDKIRASCRPTLECIVHKSLTSGQPLYPVIMVLTVHHLNHSRSQRILWLLVGLSQVACALDEFLTEGTRIGRA